MKRPAQEEAPLEPWHTVVVNVLGGIRLRARAPCQYAAADARPFELGLSYGVTIRRAAVIDELKRIIDDHDAARLQRLGA